MVIKSDTVDPGKLTDFATKAFQKVDIPEEDARIAAHILVATDLRGIESHGVNKLANYVRRIKEGQINAKPNIRIISQTPSTALMDGDQGLGFVVGYRAMVEAMHRAEKTGAGFITVRNSTHFGAAGIYSMMALEHDMIGITLNQGGKGVVAPGSRGEGVGLNVISIAAPAKEEAPFVLDMCAGVVAGGKLELAYKDGAQIPEGWVVDQNGNPVTQVTKTEAGGYRPPGGGILPLGGTPALGSYKGFGLITAVDILCNILSGGLSVPEQKGRPKTMAHFFGALRIDGFMPTDEFKKRMDAMTKAIHELPKAPGVDKIYLAGEIEHEIEQQRRQGIPLHPSVIALLQELAKELAIDYNL